MDPYAIQIHSFIVKIWLERRDDGAGPIAWHGHVTHVPGGERHHLLDVNDIASFICLTLKADDVSNEVS